MENPSGVDRRTALKIIAGGLPSLMGLSCADLPGLEHNSPFVKKAGDSVEKIELKDVNGKGHLDFPDRVQLFFFLPSQIESANVYLALEERYSYHPNRDEIVLIAITDPHKSRLDYNHTNLRIVYDASGKISRQFFKRPTTGCTIEVVAGKIKRQGFRKPRLR